jgi:FkbM family methyltransferase
VREINRLATTRYGRFLYNPSDIYIGKSLEQYGEAHEFELILLRQLCGAGDCVFDIGANIGDHTIPLAQHVGEGGRIVAFEPQRIIFQMLCANVALNSLPNVDCTHAAVGASAGSVLIPEIDYSVEDNYGGVEVSRFTEGRPVPQVTLDDCLDVPPVRLVKIDVEGMEVDALRGATRFIAKFRPTLYVENDRLERSSELISLLHQLAYRPYWHLAPLFNPDNFRGKAENVFGNVVATNLLCIPRETPLEFSGPAFPEAVDPSKHPFGEWP